MSEHANDNAIGLLNSIIDKDPTRVVLVVGSGVTRGAVVGVPGTECASWAGLVEHGIRHARRQELVSDDEARTLAERIASGDAESMIAAAESITSALGGRTSGEYQAWLRSAFAPVDEGASCTPTLCAIKDASDRGVRIATTNYDGVLERFLELETVVWSQRDQALRVLQGDENAVLHLHGHWGTSDSVIFGTSDYEALAEAPGNAELLNAVRTLKTMVFVGMGAGMLDPTFGRLRSWAARTQEDVTPQHYWFVRGSEREAVPAQTLRAERTTVVGYAEHEELPGLLRRILPSQPQAPLEREAAAAQTVALLLNVRMQTHREHFDARDLSLALELEIPDENVVELRREAGEGDVADPRWWDRIGADVRAAVGAARDRARRCGGRVEYVVAGRAPLSVFAYAGHCAFQKLVGPIRYVNLSRSGSSFDVLERGVEDGVHTDFVADTPPLGFVPVDGIRHAIYASVIHTDEVKVGAFLPLKGIREPRGANAVSVVASILPTSSGGVGIQDVSCLMDLVTTEVQRMKGALGESPCVVAYSGPTWGAFELGLALRPDVHGPIDVPHYVRDGSPAGYLPAVTLSSRRTDVWFRHPRFLFMGAEPYADSRTRVGTTFSRAINVLRNAGVSSDTSVRDDAVVSLDVMHERLSTFKPHVVQILLHGDPDGTIGLAGPTDGPRKTSADEVLAAFRRTPVRPVLVVLCVCTSTLLGERLLDVADHVVVSVNELDTRNAETFTERFFERLLEGDSIADAFETARHAEAANVPRARLRLLSSPQAVEADRVFFHRRPGE